jgi:hypothetical protein
MRLRQRGCKRDVTLADFRAVMRRQGGAPPGPAFLEAVARAKRASTLQQPRRRGKPRSAGISIAKARAIASDSECQGTPTSMDGARIAVGGTGGAPVASAVVSAPPPLPRERTLEAAETLCGLGTHVQQVCCHVGA